MRILTVLMVALVLLCAGSVQGKQNVLKDPEGNPVALIVDCNSCAKDDKATGCETGVEKGFSGGVPCGRCVLKANHGKRIPIAYDVRVSGRLKDENGKPVHKKFVRMLLPNAWAIRTLTREDGAFTLRLGATAPRKERKTITVDVGDRTMRSDSKALAYVLFMLPPEYKPCEEE